MKIVIIGAGNVATVLGKLFVQKGHAVAQVISRNAEQATLLAQQLDAVAATDLSAIDLTADLYMVSVSDAAIAGIATQLQPGDRLVVHTAGSVDKSVLQQTTASYGVLYPLQSLRKEMEQIPAIPLFVEGSNKATEERLLAFAKTLSAQVTVADSAQRLKLHVAAVMVSNFTNYLYAQAEQFCMQENVPFNFLKPLIEETALRLRDHSPAAVQTGPAMRNDRPTLEKHEALLTKYPDLQQLYRQLTEGIQKLNGA
jgi:predicted short-subunit dehydrogenase-like oxidoreductase (DUF2520 family)